MARQARTPATDRPRNEVVPLARPGHLIGSALIIFLGCCWIYSLLTNPNYSWPVVGQYLFSRPILQGLGLTIGLAVTSMVIGSAGGLILALMRMSDSKLLSATSSFYIWLLRGMPLLVLVIMLYNISYLYPTVSVSLPFGPTLWSISSNTLITPTIAAILAFSLNEAAFTAEIIRGGLMSVGRGQLEAAQALGMQRARILRRIVLPQAMRAILPAYGNEFILLLKSTSLVSVISSADLLFAAQSIYAETYQTVPLLMVTALWYLALTSLLMVAQRFIESYYNRGTKFRNRASSATNKDAVVEK